MPDRHTVLKWSRVNPEFNANYARARDLAVDAVYDDIDRVARDGGRDTIVEDIDGLRVERVDYENINRSKVIVDTLKWRASKLAPHKYGDRVAHQMLDEHGKPAKAGITVIIDGAPRQIE